MAAYTSLLLVIALCAATALSLQCYTCVSESSNDDCLAEGYCTIGDTYCQTSVASVTIAGISFSNINKDCASLCSPSSTNILGISSSVSCCSTDLCNVSGGAIVKSSYAAILLALGSILKSSVL
ncbi:ly6/PLAUR domain-containing protein 2-like [Bufo gargarizans]|uniref:ly6/PLAUR domain-containing protein 2-like n=1 Tax=Bufo gargarizans TaxID=30331 RepID=UPI001CF2D61A|nr:ly6/PLAUR domain-containing protein 2-like [Bufo gargarizans]XP_044129531.1 ly6/PLAUR domain-containing protein 2-like [Bufo gargarizans]